MSIQTFTRTTAVRLGDRVLGIIAFPYRAAAALAGIGTASLAAPIQTSGQETTWVLLVAGLAAADITQFAVRRHRGGEECDSTLDHAERCSGCWDYLYGVAHLPATEADDAPLYAETEVGR
ncbi:hypothetical protein ABZW10_36455 [Kitasatospora sp. NPDC004723]|uniref:hypothetical protein n=1 Tax=Kitasatospora sp. NPDC004723 TaxID=3154288 RepID=UPI0033A0F313